jgi:molybdenum cofactor cytidylyltransferase
LPERVGGLVLAAGAGRRFGGPKQLAPFDGRPLLEHALRALAQTPGLVRRVVVLGARAQEIAAAVDLHGVEPVVVAGWEEGQAASLRAGVAALGPDLDAVVVTLGDQPLIGPATIARLAAEAAGPAPAARATWGGVPGHPVLLRRPLLDAIPELRGDAGARALLTGDAVRLVPCGPEAVADVDTPQQLAALAPRRRPAGEGGPGG